MEDALSCPEPAVCNNAIWATGELSLHLRTTYFVVVMATGIFTYVMAGEKLAPHVPALVVPLVMALDNVESDTLAENAGTVLQSAC